MQNVDFIGATFLSAFVAKLVNFNGYTTFSRGIFVGSVDFEASGFSSESNAVDFSGIIAKNKVCFDKVNFKEAVLFDEAVFRDEVSFKEAIFLKIIDFAKTTFKKWSDFGGVKGTYSGVAVTP